ncbi:hypothetical protein E2C01_066276 [Portunus trituberculatus]|uniref:Uncharacterized protein n=1 Tax=Portunus trituberculatus TaxID=210409 RepID=A0A5B7HU84_PORTR|nr:hypothetical protein [Portunus trituberculatus]
MKVRRHGVWTRRRVVRRSDVNEMQCMSQCVITSTLVLELIMTKPMGVFIRFSPHNPYLFTSGILVHPSADPVSPLLTSPHLTSPHLTSHHITSHHIPSFHFTSLLQLSSRKYSSPTNTDVPEEQKPRLKKRI